MTSLFLKESMRSRATEQLQQRLGDDDETPVSWEELGQALDAERDARLELEGAKQSVKVAKTAHDDAVYQVRRLHRLRRQQEREGHIDQETGEVLRR